jgi:NitT/TauT family transport system substrate-binding protein
MKMRLLSLAMSTAMFLAPMAASAADDVKLILDWTPGGFEASWYYGIEKGCFQDQGINLKVQRGYGGADTVTKIAAGVGDFGIADLSSIMLGKLTANAAVTAIMPQYTASPISIGILAGSGIKTISDLEGKTVAAAPGDSGIKILPVSFEEAGAHFSKVKVETVDFSTLSGLLIQGKVDAITTYSTTAMIIDAAAKKAGKSVITIPFVADLGVYSNSIFTSDKMIEKNKDLVERFKRASVCSFEKARDDLPAAVAAMDRSVGGMDEALHTAIAKASIPLIFTSPNFKATGWKWNEIAVAKTLDVAVRAQEQKTDARPMSFVLND